MKTVIILLALIISGTTAFAQTDGDKANSAYKKAKIKNRAHLQAERGTDSIGNKQYIYAADGDVDEAIRLQKGTNQFSIGSINLERGTQIKEVNILVEGRGKKDIEVESTGNEPAEVNIGHVTVDKGVQVKKVTSIIEMQVNVKEK